MVWAALKLLPVENRSTGLDWKVESSFDEKLLMLRGNGLEVGMRHLHLLGRPEIGLEPLDQELRSVIGWEVGLNDLIRS